MNLILLMFIATLGNFKFTSTLNFEQNNMISKVEKCLRISSLNLISDLSEKESEFHYEELLRKTQKYRTNISIHENKGLEKLKI